MTERRYYDGIGPTYTQQGCVVAPDGTVVRRISVVSDGDLIDRLAVQNGSFNAAFDVDRRPLEECGLKGAPAGSKVEWGPILRHEKFAFETGLPVT